MTQPISDDPAYIEALIAETKAKTANLLVDNEIKQAERDFRQAEARRSTAYAKSAEQAALVSEIQTATALRSEAVNKAATGHLHHEFPFNAEVGDDSVEICLAQLALWHRMDNACPMQVTFTSPGGSVIDGMALFDQITAYSLREWDTTDRPKGTHETTGIIRGWAASMAGILMQAFDKRIMGPEAYLMIHQVSSWNQGSLGELKDHMQWLEEGLTRRVRDIFVRRSGGKCDNDQFDKIWERKSTYLDSTEALKYGFVDGIG